MFRGFYPVASRSRPRRLAVLQARQGGIGVGAGNDGASGANAFVETVSRSASKPGGADHVGLSNVSDAGDGVALAAVSALFRGFGITASESFLAQDVPMSLSRFKRLVAQMPKIAEVVNQFQSTEIQREVLQALVRAFEAQDMERGEKPGAPRDSNGHGIPSLNDAPVFLDEPMAALIGGDAESLGGDESSIHS